MPLKVSDGIGAWIKDFQKSDAPQFKGKNKEERRDMAIAAYLTAKRGPEKEQKVQDEAMDAKRKAEMDRAMAAFKKRGGKITKVAPGRAQGAHGKDDPASGMRGMLDRGDTKKFKTRKKIRSMGEGVMEARAPKMTYALVGAKDMKIYSMGSDEKDLRSDKRSLEKRFNQPLKLARLKTAQRIGDKVGKSQIKESVIWEAVDPKMRKVKQLATLGLVGKSDVNKLMMAMKSMDDGKEVKPQHRKIIFDAFADLIDLVTGDTQVFQKAKKKVKEQYDYGTDDSVKHMKKVTPGQTAEARVIDTKAMAAYQKYAKAKKVDDDSIRMAHDNPNHPETKRMMKNKSFATALKMYKGAKA